MISFKFRCWDKEVGKMFKVVQFSHSIYRDCEQAYVKTCGLRKDPTDPKTKIGFTYIGDIMQYIGKKDKKNKEIYEGDIIITNKLKDIPFVVIYDNKRSCFSVLDKTCCKTHKWQGWLQQHSSKDIEIIGNIYENPKKYTTNKNFIEDVKEWI